MGVHESQSLFWERLIFQSREFWVFATPIVHKYFPHTAEQTAEGIFESIDIDNLYLLEFNQLIYSRLLSVCESS